MPYVLIETKAGGRHGMGHIVRMTHLARELIDRGALVTMSVRNDKENYATGMKYLTDVGMIQLTKVHNKPITHYVQDFPMADNIRLQYWSNAARFVVVGVGKSITPDTRRLSDTIFWQGIMTPHDNVLSAAGGDVHWGLKWLLLDRQYEDLPLVEQGEYVVIYAGANIDMDWIEKLYLKLDSFEIPVVLRYSGNSDDMYNLMASARLVISAMGMTVYEAIRLEKPVLCFSATEDHAHTADELVPRVWHGGLQKDLHYATIAQIALLYFEGKHPYEGNEMRKFYEYPQYKDLDGFGTARVAERILCG